MVDDILAKKIYPREKYLSRIKNYFGSPVIKVIIGPRRVGKSYLMQSLIQTLVREKGYDSSRVLYINKELPVRNYIETSEDLLQYVDNRSKGASGNLAILIDEVQEILGREKVLNGWLATYEQDIELWISGSNAHMLSSDLSTLIAGRYITIPVFPLSLFELSEMTSQSVDKALLSQYLITGGLPGVTTFVQEEEVIFSYLRSIYDTIFLKDIIMYHQVNNTDFFQKLFKYVLKNVGTIFSAKSIRDYLKNQGVRISIDTVLTYLQYGQQAYLISKLESQSPLTKKFFAIYNKYYVHDVGVRNSLVGYQHTRDMSKVLENYVYNVLNREGYMLTIGRLKNGKEIDFIAEKDGSLLFVQVCYSLLGEQVREREYGSLLSLKNSRPKYVVTMDDEHYGVYEGVQHIHAWELEKVL